MLTYIITILEMRRRGVAAEDKKDDQKKREKKVLKKDEINVDFDMTVREDWKEVFGSYQSIFEKKKPTPSKLAIGKDEFSQIKQSYLLPIDRHVDPKR